MSQTADILFAETGQSLTFDCPAGRPSSVTSVTVWETAGDDTSQAEVATTGAASVETDPNTTVDVLSGPSAASADPKRVNLTATTGTAIGRRFLLASATYGHSEWIEVEGVVSGDYILSRYPLLNDYEATSTLKSTRCSISLDSTWVSDLTNLSTDPGTNPRYRVRWEVIVNSVTLVFDTYFDLVRYIGQHTVTPLNVADRFKPWLDWLGPDDRIDQGRSRIQRAWRSVSMELAGDDKGDQTIRNRELLDELVIARTIFETMESRQLSGASLAPEEVDTATKLWRQRYDQFVRAPVIAVDVNGGGASQTIQPQPLWSR